MTARPSPLEFAKAFWPNWGERMSGPPSVPLMLAALVIPNHDIAIGTGLLGVGCAIFAAYRVWHTERNRVVDLEKISRADLQRMLNGVFLGDTFLMGGEINFGKQYKGTFALDQLADEFDRVEVRAPGGAVADIRVQIHGRREWGGKISVSVRDGAGRVKRIENIYEPVRVLLGSSGEFFVKLARDESVVFDEDVSVWVTIDSWTK